MAPINGAKMEQKKNSADTSAIAGRNDRDKDFNQLLFAVETNRTTSRLNSAITDAGTLPLLAAAMSTLLTVTTPVDLEFDHQPAADAFWRPAVESVCAHFAVNSPGDLEDHVDAIRFGVKSMPQLNPDGVSVKGCSIMYAPAGQAGE